MLYLFDYVSISTNQFQCQIGCARWKWRIILRIDLFGDCFLQKPADFFLILELIFLPFFLNKSQWRLNDIVLKAFFYRCLNRLHCRTLYQIKASKIQIILEVGRFYGKILKSLLLWSCVQIQRKCHSRVFYTEVFIVITAQRSCRTKTRFWFRLSRCRTSTHSCRASPEKNKNPSLLPTHNSLPASTHIIALHRAFITYFTYTYTHYSEFKYS